jgi:voltage-gated potassium channel Kch
MTASLLHARLANTAGLYFLLLALWGFWRFFRKQGLDPAFRGALAVGEVLVVFQALLGGYLWLAGLRPARAIHLLYGLLIPAVIPTAYAYTKGREGRAEILIHATALLIGAGLVMRAAFTGEVLLP